MSTYTTDAYFIGFADPCSTRQPAARLFLDESRKEGLTNLPTETMRKFFPASFERKDYSCWPSVGLAYEPIPYCSSYQIWLAMRYTGIIIYSGSYSASV